MFILLSNAWLSSFFFSLIRVINKYKQIAYTDKMHMLRKSLSFPLHLFKFFHIRQVWVPYWASAYTLLLYGGSGVPKASSFVLGISWKWVLEPVIATLRGFSLSGDLSAVRFVYLVDPFLLAMLKNSNINVYIHMHPTLSR